VRHSSARKLDILEYFDEVISKKSSQQNHHIVTVQLTSSEWQGKKGFRGWFVVLATVGIGTLQSYGAEYTGVELSEESIEIRLNSGLMLYNQPGRFYFG
jgi:hypothetical protein